MVDMALERPVAFGYAIALGELAVGIGALLGLFTRLATLGGALISLSLWLTVSWASDPYYYGNDLPYLMAWTPLVLAGALALATGHQDRELAPPRGQAMTSGNRGEARSG